MIKNAVICLVFIALVACDGKKPNPEHSTTIIRKVTKVESPELNQRITLGDTIQFRLGTTGEPIDSVTVRYQGELTTFAGSEFAWSPSTSRTGRLNFQLTAHFGTQSETHFPRLTLLSDIVPEEYGYIVVGAYPHDASAFTQGLFYENGDLIESTGQRGESVIRRVSLFSGEVKSNLPLEDRYFGEGCTLHNDEIYQVTWLSNVGFVYDKDLNLLRSFDFNYQGWGLTTKGDSLVLTQGNEVQGSEFIYYMNPGDFSEIGRIEVYNHLGPVTNLNELEYIHGTIYANEWQTNNIHVIDPDTGKVLKTVDLSGLLTPEEAREADLLNGIAYDHEGDRLFVTGKYWPYLFEIKLQPKI